MVYLKSVLPPNCLIHGCLLDIKQIYVQSKLRLSKVRVKITCFKVWVEVGVGVGVYVGVGAGAGAEAGNVKNGRLRQPWRKKALYLQ